jgi:octaprenyl-diphosphate synthase
MQGVLDIPAHLLPLAEALTTDLDAVASVFDAELASDLPPLADMLRHVERYRGKMLRPSLVMLFARAAGAATPHHHVLAAVCEMVHMATLVHDDVLDDAQIRRRSRTLNSLRGNEQAVILGDYLIASAFRLCASLPEPAYALDVAATAKHLCAGELLQLDRREDWSLDETTYLEILDHKTASLIAAACRLGARLAGAAPAAQAAAEIYGRALGVAFQIQDDLLDLTGDQATVGKSVGKDAEKGKLTLPLIHHLRTAPPAQRGRTLLLLESAAASADDVARAELVRAVESTASIAHARSYTQSLIDRAAAALDSLSPSPARDMLALMARAVAERSH